MIQTDVANSFTGTYETGTDGAISLGGSSADE